MNLPTIRIGDGPKATVLLHGFMGSGKNLRTLATRWLERDPARMFLLPDLPGHGTAPSVSERTDLREMAQAVVSSARAEGAGGPLEIVGHSLGGRVGLAASLAFAPGDVARVTFLDITPSPIRTEVSESGKVMDKLLRAPASAPDRRTLRQALLDDRLSQPLTDWLMMNVEETDGVYRWRFDREALARLHVRVNAEDLWAAVERRRVPVMCIRGSRSAYVPAEDIERMKRANCPVHEVESGHFVHVEALDALVELLSRAP